MKRRLYLFLTAGAVLALSSSSPAQDFVTVRRISDCCFSLTVLNRNADRKPINELAVKCSPSVRILTNGVAPPGWSLQYLAPQSARFTASMVSIPAGGLLSGFQLCFLALENNFRIDWITLRNNDLLTSGFTEVSCRDTDSLDVLRNPSSDGCCHLLTLRNRNNELKPINVLTLDLLTPGYIVSNFTWPAAWRATTAGAGSFRFESSSSPLVAGGNLPGFAFCLLPSTGPADSVEFEWTTRDGNTVLTRDTMVLRCEDIRRCDILFAAADSAATCCYDLTLLNNHAPESRLDELRLKMLTPGARFSNIASTVWPVLESSASSARIGSTTIPLESRAVLAGMKLCVENAPSKTDPLQVLWETWRSGKPICSDTLQLECAPPVVPACDSIFHSVVKDCDLRFGFRNTHVPTGVLNGFRVRTLTPGAILENAMPPAAWTVQSRTPTAVVWRSNTDVNNKVLIVGFTLSLQPAGSGTQTLLELCTMLNGNLVCCDTVAISCTPQVRCDSLLLEPGAGACGWSLGFVNLHRPFSPVGGFRVSLTTPGAPITNAVPPGGFELTFLPAVSNPLVEFDWCSTDGGADICCGIASVQCEPPAPRCDSLILRPTEEDCSFDAGFSNLHTPVSPVNGFSVDVATPGAAISSASAAPGWITEDADARRVVFRDTGAGIAHADTRTGFLLSLIPSASGSSIRLVWRTMLDSTALCADTVLVECETAERSMDTVSVLPDPERPCCSEFRLHNRHTPASIIIRFDVRVLTPYVLLFASQVSPPAGWTHASTTTDVRFSTVSAGLSYGSILEGCEICFDNSATGHDPFEVGWEAYSGITMTSSDTIRLECDRTLFVERSAGAAPSAFALRQNYPNPLRKRTRVEFDVPSAGIVRLSLLDASGRLVRTLAEGTFDAGVFGLDVDASRLPAGIYFYCLEFRNQRITRAMTVLP